MEINKAAKKGRSSQSRATILKRLVKEGISNKVTWRR